MGLPLSFVHECRTTGNRNLPQILVISFKYQGSDKCRICRKQRSCFSAGLSAQHLTFWVHLCCPVSSRLWSSLHAALSSRSSLWHPAGHKAMELIVLIMGVSNTISVYKILAKYSEIWTVIFIIVSPEFKKQRKNHAAPLRHSDKYSKKWSASKKCLATLDSNRG